MIPAGMKKCDHGCGRNVPEGHTLCDWCAAEHIRKQLKLVKDG